MNDTAFRVALGAGLLLMALVIRAELFEPGMQFVDPLFFNSMTTLHALIMVFGAVMPELVGRFLFFLAVFSFSKKSWNTHEFSGFAGANQPHSGFFEEFLSLIKPNCLGTQF